MDPQLRESKERFVSQLTGSTFSELCLVTFVVPVSRASLSFASYLKLSLTTEFPCRRHILRLLLFVNLFIAAQSSIYLHNTA